MFEKFVLMFFIFGCWFQFLDSSIGYVAYNIWMVLVVAWILLNALSTLIWAVRKNKNFDYPITPRVINHWMCLNLLSLVSFYMCGETIISILFVLTAVLFTLMVSVNSQPKKRKRR